MPRPSQDLHIRRSACFCVAPACTTTSSAMADSKRQSVKRRATTSISYKEESSGNESSDSVQISVPAKKLRLSKAPAAATTPNRKSSTRGRSQGRQLDPKKSVTSRPPPIPKSKNCQKVQRGIPCTAYNVVTDGVVPLWSSLPYEILLEIFRYASLPLRDENFQPNESLAWLLKTARLCKSFAAPALAVLYESPPLLALEKPHRLLDLLVEDEDRHFIDNYKTKVKCLELDTKLTLAYTATGRGLFDISALIPLLPRLSSINITNSRDRPPFRRISQKGKWAYPVSLFDVLRQSSIQLKAWRWHGEMITENIGALHHIHAQSAFQSLQRLSVSHLHFLSNGEAPSKRQKSTVQADFLASLVHLSSLSLESCQSESWELLNHLPKLLTNLSVINCPTFDNGTLLPYLVEHGRELKNLVLNHNRSMSLEFLPDLKQCCPELESLYMDFTYYSASIFGDLGHQSDATPNYNSLLEPGNIPTWPTTLRDLSLLQMRKWSVEAATGFFESLTTSAPDLPNLKYVTIKAILDISWRERAGFREKWINRFDEALLRRPRSPNIHLASKRVFREWKEKHQEHAVRPPTRASISEEASYAGSGGTCEIVDVSIDNMRPSELRFREEDFMDSEISGDEDWNGDNEFVAPTRHAW